MIGSVLVLAFLLAAAVVAIFYVTEPAYGGRTVVEWLDELQNPDTNAQAAAQQAIRQLGRQAVPAIIDLLEARDGWLKTKCLELESRQSFFEFPFHLAAEQRSEAFEACRLLGPAAEDALPALVELAEIEPSAIPVMAGLGRGSIYCLLRALDNPKRSIRLNAIDALGGLRGASFKVVPALMKMLAGKETEAKVFSIKSLGAIQPASEEVLPALVQSLADPSPSVRRMAATVIAKYGPLAKAAVPGLLRGLEDPNPNVRRAAGLSLYGVDPSLAVKVFKDLFAGEPAAEWLARALLQIGPEGLAILSTGLTNSNPVVRARTFSFISGARGDGGRSVPLLLTGLKDSDPSVRRISARALAAMGSIAVQQVPLFVELLEDRDPEVKCSAVLALRQAGMQAKLAAQKVARLLDDDNPAVRAVSASFLKAINEPAYP